MGSLSCGGSAGASPSRCLPRRFYCTANRTFPKLIRRSQYPSDHAPRSRFSPVSPMRRSTLHRLLRKSVALVAIAVMAGLQPMLSACTCGLAVPQSAAEATVEAESCCAGCCSASSDSLEASGSTCCDATSQGPQRCDDCSCCDAAEESPLPPSTTSVQDDTHSASVAHLAIFPTAFHSGLNGAAWHNAFDLTSPGRPPGIRLHALLSVWQI